MSSHRPALPMRGAADGPGSLRALIEGELIPRLLLAHQVGPIPPSLAAAAARELDEHDLDEFLARVLDAHDGATADFIADLLADGIMVESVYLDLLAPTARRLGELWDEDRADFLQVTIALGRLQRVLRELSRGAGDPVPALPVGRVLLAGAPGDDHSLGLLMVAEFFVRAGWGVALGPPISELDLIETVRADSFDVVGLSLGTDARLGAVKRLIAQVRLASHNPHLVVLVGGRVFSDRPDLVDRVGADGTVADARLAPAVALAFIRRRESSAAAASQRPGVAAPAVPLGSDLSPRELPRHFG